MRIYWIAIAATANVAFSYIPPMVYPAPFTYRQSLQPRIPHETYASNTNLFASRDATSTEDPRTTASSQPSRRLATKTLLSIVTALISPQDCLATGGITALTSSPQTLYASSAATPTPTPPPTQPRTQTQTDPITLRISNPKQRLGLELYETKLKTGTQLSPVVAIRSVIPNGAADSINIPGEPKLRPGMILLEYSTKTQLADRFQKGPYPIELRFGTVGGTTGAANGYGGGGGGGGGIGMGGGDAINDMGKPLIPPEEGLRIAQSEAPPSTEPQYVTRVITKPTTNSNLQSRRLDVLEINYTARYGYPPRSLDLPVYDSSLTRGTGRPYQFVLGSGDMIPGVDLGLYDMVPGEIRQLDIPPALGYGVNGSRFWKIPGGMSLFWTVELVSVNEVRAGDSRSREDVEMNRVAYE